MTKQYLWKQAKELFVLVVLAVTIRTFGFGHYRVPTISMETTMLTGENYFVDKMSYLFRNPERGEIISFNDPNFEYSENQIVRTFQHYLWGPQNWTKRVIGVPGDHVQGRIEDAKPVIYRNGQKLDEPYTNKYPLIPVDVECNEWRSYDPAKSFDNQPFYYRLDPEKIQREQLKLQRYGYPSQLDPQTLLPAYCAGSDVFDVKLGANQYWAMGDDRLGSDDSRRWGPLDRKYIHGRILFRIFSNDPQNQSLILDILMHPIDFWTRIRWNRCLQVVN
jgi:signal peptidase I